MKKIADTIYAVTLLCNSLLQETNQKVEINVREKFGNNLTGELYVIYVAYVANITLSTTYYNFLGYYKYLLNGVDTQIVHTNIRTNIRSSKS